MTDYREIFGISELAAEACFGNGARVAVIDVSIPCIDDIFVCHRRNMTLERAEGDDHTTFIGSILFGEGTVKGLCPWAMSCFIKVFENGLANPETVARAITYAALDWHADVINLSLGFPRSLPCPNVLKEACEKAVSNGTAIIAAAGNDGGDVLWPAALPGVICVGASQGSSKSTFSNHGEIDFVVPGCSVTGQGHDGRVIEHDGTSFSTAFITGFYALLLARRRRQGTLVSPSIIKNELIDRCLDLGDPGWDPDTGYGMPVFAVRGSAAETRGRLQIASIFGKIKKLIKSILSRLKKRRNTHEI